MKSKILLSVFVICLVFVLVGCSGVVSPVTEATETTANFQETISSLDTPEKLSDWMLKNIKYESHYEIWVETGVQYIASPEEIFESKRGDCADFAVFACAVLEYHGYETKILAISVASDPSLGHAVCVYHSSEIIWDWIGPIDTEVSIRIIGYSQSEEEIGATLINPCVLATDESYTWGPNFGADIWSRFQENWPWWFKIQIESLDDPTNGFSEFFSIQWNNNL